MCVRGGDVYGARFLWVYEKTIDGIHAARQMNLYLSHQTQFIFFSVSLPCHQRPRYLEAFAKPMGLF